MILKQLIVQFALSVDTYAYITGCHITRCFLSVRDAREKDKVKEQDNTHGVVVLVVSTSSGRIYPSPYPLPTEGVS